MWQIELSRQADKFAKKENIKDMGIIGMTPMIVFFR
jgi:hypothetical protein